MKASTKTETETLYILSTLFFFFSQVLDVISALKDLKREEAAQVMYDNTMRMFFPKV